MSENVQITPGSGVTIGADSVTDVTLGSAQIQYIKIMDGTIGGTNKAAVTANGLVVDGSAVTQPISAVSLPLPTGAATEATLGVIETNTNNLDVLLSTRATELTLSGIKTQTDKLTFVASRLLIDGSGVTQPVSGTGNFTVVQPTGTNLHTVVDSGTITVGNASLAVTQSTSPWVVSLASTTITGTVAVTQSTSPWVVSGTVTSNIGTTGGLALDSSVNGLLLVQSSITSGEKGPLIQGAVTTASPSYATGQTNPLSLTLTGALRVDGSAVTQPISGSVSVSNFPVTQNVNVINTSIPVSQFGSWTVSLTTESIEIGTVDQGTPNTLANAWPVELSDGTNLLGTSTHPVRIDPTGTTTQPVSVTNFPATQPVSGTVTALQGTSPWVVSGTVTVGNASLAVTQSGVWSVGRTWTLASGTDSISTVQSGTWNINNISGTISLPTGASTSANQTNGNQKTQIVDGSGNVIASTSNALNVDVTNFPATTAVTQSTSPWVVSLASTTITGTVAVTQSTSPWVISGTVTTTPPANASTNITQWDSVALGAPSAYGTSPGAVNVIGVNAFITNTPTVTANAGTGNFTVVQPTGTNLHTVVDSGSITSNIGTTGGLALDATVSGLQVGQGSTTSGQKGDLIQGAVTTAAPSYSTAQTSPLSLTLAGALRVDGSAVTQPVSGTVIIGNASIAVTQSGTWTTGRTWDLASGTDSVSAVQSGTWTVQPGNTPNTTPWLSTISQGGNSATVTAANALKVDGSGVTQPVNGTVTANQGSSNVLTPWAQNLTQISGSSIATAAAGIAKIGLTDGSGNAITSTTIGSAQTLDVNLPDRTSTISLTAVAQTAQVSMVGKNSVAFVLTSMGTGGQVICEGSLDGVTWQGLDTWQESQESWVDNGTVITIADQFWVEPIGALWFVRVRCTAITSGTITGLFYVSSATMGTYEFQGSSGTNLPNNILLIGGKTNDITPQFQQIPLGPAGRSHIIEGVSGGVPVAENLTQVGGVAITAVTSKTTQPSSFMGVQEAKDSGRTYVTFTADAIAGVVSETLITFTLNKQGTATGSQTNYTPTSGKTLRIQSISLGIQSGAGAGAWTRIKLRHNTAGATTTSSALVYTTEHGTLNATAIASGISVPIPDGLEIFGDGTQTIGITHISSATTAIESITVCGYEY